MLLKASLRGLKKKAGGLGGAQLHVIIRLCWQDDARSDLAQLKKM